MLPWKESVRQTNMPRAFMSMATSSSAPTPRPPTASRKSAKLANEGVPSPHSPSRSMYPRLRGSLAPARAALGLAQCQGCVRVDGNLALFLQTQQLTTSTCLHSDRVRLPSEAAATHIPTRGGSALVSCDVRTQQEPAHAHMAQASRQAGRELGFW